MASDVFISYSWADQAAAEQVERALLDAKIEVWRDRNRGRAGQNITDEIAAAIDGCRAIVWLVSSSSVESMWVRRELVYATDSSKLIIPVLLSSDALEHMPGGLRMLFPHILYVDLEEQGLDDGFEAIIKSIEMDGVESERVESRQGDRITTSTVEQIGAVATPQGLDLLPIDVNSPLIIGFAIDVSGSMIQVMETESAGQTNRLEGVLDSIRDLGKRYRMHSASQEVASSSKLARLFAYGFGFADRAAKYGKLGPLAKRFVKDAPPIPSQIFHGSVRDLLEIAEVDSHTLSLEELDAQWEAIQERVWEQRVDLGGKTMMREVLKAVADRFNSEFTSYDGIPHSALFLASDGESKDGSPLDACDEIASSGTVILSCYLTDQDIAEPKRLFSRPQPNWPKGAETLFRCSSTLEEDSVLLPLLREKGWSATEGDRLFVQLNQSELLSEFVSFVLDVGVS